MNWVRSTSGAPAAIALFDRHYSRQTPGGQVTPPGRSMVLLTEDQRAVWVTSWPFAIYVKRRFADAWLCSLFRNEGPILSSELIRQAVAVTRYAYGDPPESGMVTMVDAGKVKPKRDPGRCFRRAGFEPAGYTLSGLLILKLDAAAMPDPAAPFTPAPLFAMV